MRNKLFVSMTALVLLALPLVSLRKRKVLSAARKKVPKKAVVPLVLSVLL